MQARAWLLSAPHESEVVRYDLPTIGSEDGLLRVEIAGVCGTDLKILHGRYGGTLGSRSAAYPLVPGHEICGVIEEVGEVAAERWGVKPGDRVAVDSFVACGLCSECLGGRTRYCMTMGDYGVSISATRSPHLWGGFAEYVYLAPGAQVYKLPDGMSPELGVLAPAVVSNAVAWVDVAGGAGVGSTVLICGPGPIGLACVVVARSLGASLVMISGLESDQARLDLAKSLGAHQTLIAGEEVQRKVLDLTDGEGVDVVVDVSGSPASLAQAPALVRRQGTIVAAGLTGNRPSELPIDDLVFQEITLKGVFSHDRAALIRALRFLAANPSLFEGFVSHRYPLEQTTDAIEIVGKGDATLLKSVVEPWTS